MSDLPLQRVVPFEGDELVAAKQSDGTILVAFSRLCENLGLNRRGQVQRVQRHTIMNRGLVSVTVDTEGGPQTIQCLRLDLLPLWLSGVQASRVKPELQEKLTRYQEEAATVLWDAFKDQIVINEDTAQANHALELKDDAAIQQLQQIAEMGRAITHLAEQQIEIQRQQQTLTNRMDRAAQVVKALQGDLTNVQVRLTLLEDQVHPTAAISDAQATEISNQVKALAELLTGKEKSKNHYQGIFGELYRRFGVSSYKLIRQQDYEAVLDFLKDWHTAATS